MSSEANKINVSAEAYSAIEAAMEQVFAKTGKKPKYSEVQAIYKTSNSYIQHVMQDWLDKHKEDLNKKSEQPNRLYLLMTRRSKHYPILFCWKCKKRKTKQKLS